MPRDAQTGHTWHKSALSPMFSDHPRQSLRPAHKTGPEDKFVHPTKTEEPAGTGDFATTKKEQVT